MWNKTTFTTYNTKSRNIWPYSRIVECIQTSISRKLQTIPRKISILKIERQTLVFTRFRDKIKEKYQKRTLPKQMARSSWIQIYIIFIENQIKTAEKSGRFKKSLRSHARAPGPLCVGDGALKIIILSRSHAPAYLVAHRKASSYHDREFWSCVWLFCDEVFLFPGKVCGNWSLVKGLIISWLCQD